jgi:hypothetical protein
MAISLANLDIGGLFSGIGTLAKDIRTAITGKEPINADKAAEIALKLEELEGKARDSQTAVNLAEAANPNIFVSGWRPAAGWVCVLGLFYATFLRPMISWLSTICGFTAVPPVIDTVILMELLFGMLGLGAFRSYDMAKGTKKENI